MTQPSGETRTLVCRLTRESDTAWEWDPVKAGVSVHEFYLAAEDPYWQGAPLVRSWGSGEPVDFFGTTGGPPFFISRSSTIDTASVRNPGDVRAWPRWRIDGPTTSVELGVGSSVVEVPFAVADGAYLTVDTSPTAQTAILSDGTDKTGDLGAVEFAPIEPGAEVPLSLVMSGTGTVTATITPRFYTAW